ncbi:MAG: leucine-rich repeat domain-containing protein, partial [Clostridia bacterium]
AEGNSVYEIREKDDNHNGNLYKIDGNVLLRYLPTNEETEYTITNETYSIAFGAFSDNDNLITINLNNVISTIGQGAFYNIEKLENVTNLDNIISVEYFAFMNTNISEITFGSNIINLNNNCFDGCNNLNTITINNTTDIVIIGDGNYSLVTLKVASELLDSYKNIYSNKFMDIVAK